MWGAWQTMIEQFDTDKNGEIDYPEFLAMMRANNKDLQARVPLHCLRPGWLCALLGSCQTWRQGGMSPGAQFVWKKVPGHSPGPGTV